MVELESVHKTYPLKEGSIEVLSGLGAAVKEGEFVAVFGRSGSGKSTLFNLIGGLDRDYRGRIRVDGQALEKLSDKDLSRLRGATIGFVFQTPFFPGHLDCLSNLAFAASFAGGRDNGEDILALLESLGLAELSARRPDELSGGQLQRLALARAIVGSPKILLCDEPTGNLDIETGRRVIDELKKLNHDGMTLLVATHDRRVAETCDRVLELKDGQLTEEIDEGTGRSRPGGG